MFDNYNMQDEENWFMFTDLLKEIKWLSMKFNNALHAVIRKNILAEIILSE